MSPAIHMNESCPIWISHDFLICDMTHSYEVMSYTWHTKHDLFISDMTHSYEWQDSFICDKYEWVMSYMNKSCHSCLIGSMTWHIHIGHDSFICETWPIWPIHMYMTHLYVWHEWSDVCIWGELQLHSATHCNTHCNYMCDMSEVTRVCEASHSGHCGVGTPHCHPQNISRLK